MHTHSGTVLCARVLVKNPNFLQDSDLEIDLTY